MADKIVVMHDGIVEQIGAPLDLYDRPDNLFVAGFIGSPAMNCLTGTLRLNGKTEFEGPGGVRLPVGNAPAGSDGRAAVYGIRPEHFVHRRRRRRGRGAGRRADRIGNPDRRQTRRRRNHSRVFRERHQFKPGDKIRLKPDPRLVHLFDETTGKRLSDA